jgi:hypothetical protein
MNLKQQNSPLLLSLFFVARGGQWWISMCLWAGEWMRSDKGGQTITKNEQMKTQTTKQPTNSHCFSGSDAGAHDGSGAAGVLKYNSGVAAAAAVAAAAF